MSTKSDKTKRPVGRPPKANPTGKKVSLGLKVIPSIKHLLDQTAAANGRTQSQEAEARLEASFKSEGLLGEVLALRYGRPLAGLLVLLGEVARSTTTYLDAMEVFEDGQWPGGPNSWLQDPRLFLELQRALVLTLEQIKPPGEMQPLEHDYAAMGVEQVLDDKATANAGASLAEMIKPFLDRIKEGKPSGHRS